MVRLWLTFYGLVWGIIVIYIMAIDQLSRMGHGQ